MSGFQPRMLGVLASFAFWFVVGCEVEDKSSIPPVVDVSGDVADAVPVATPPVTEEPISVLKTEADASRFLARAGWGGSESEIAALLDSEAEDWLVAELEKSPTYTLENVMAQPRRPSGQAVNDSATNLYWDHMVLADDVLRQRMAFALSQIFVFSDVDNQTRQFTRAYYQDLLIRNAFGNYRDLLEDVTYSPAMATWLTYFKNRKGNAAFGRMPDENYAREILQLFSIGVVELNMDGTPKLDAQGREIETYTNDDIVGLSRVFTGLSGKGESFDAPDSDFEYHPLIMYQEYHSPLDKNFLGVTIPAGTSGDLAIRIALDSIFEHPNVPPFISRQLIQRFTSSNPSPEYVERVAIAFETGTFVAPNGDRFGSTGRGDLTATIAAILLDETVLMSGEQNNQRTSTGKVREPVLRFMHWVKAFEVQNINAKNEARLRTTVEPDTGLSQQPFRSPSVFNFYRPGYIAPGTASGEAGLTAPEMQIINDSSVMGYMNFMSEFAFDRSGQLDESIRTYAADYSTELELVDELPDLVDHLDLLLTNGRMSEQERESILYILEALPVNNSTPELADVDRLQIVQTAVALVLNSPAFSVVW